MRFTISEKKYGALAKVLCQGSDKVYVTETKTYTGDKTMWHTPTADGNDLTKAFAHKDMAVNFLMNEAQKLDDGGYCVVGRWTEKHIVMRNNEGDRIVLEIKTELC